MLLKDFDYHLPEDLIATSPIVPRDEARLLSFSQGDFSEYQVKDLTKILKAGDLLILNDTKVIHAKLSLILEGKKFIFDLYEISEAGKAEAFVKNCKKLRLGQEIIFAPDLKAKILEINFGKVKMSFFGFEDSFLTILEKYGSPPLPPYIYKKVGERIEDKKNYQTIFAKNLGSVASPTAGLHFTEDLLVKLQMKQVKIAYVTLHVGIGTFLPVKSENIDDHVMHEEWGSLSRETVNLIEQTKKNGGKVIAVGSTSTRLLESVHEKFGKLREYDGKINIFIKPGFKFKVIDILMTNFHIPKSSLLMMVAGFIGYKETFVLYREAIKRRFRFYSYGDACLLHKKLEENVKLQSYS